MGNKINIAELLKDCPKGMELDYALFEDTIFIGVEEDKNYPILIKLKDGSQKRLTKYGCHSNADYAKCVIYPKGKTTWEGFQRPFKDGDIVADDIFPFIYKDCDKTKMVKSYCGINTNGNFWTESNRWTTLDKIKFATEEQKEKLFKAIKYNGYRWNPETKKLEKLIKPYFKVWDKIRRKNDKTIIKTIYYVYHDSYALCDNHQLYFKEQDEWELVPNKFDVTTLKPFDKVLVRDFDDEVWEINFFSRLLDTKYFRCCDLSYIQCIPYKGNEYLHGTTNTCNDYFKTWES